MNLLSKYQTIKYHRKLWRWLAETGADNKLSWPGWETENLSKRHIWNDCFPCDLAVNLSNATIKCQMCIFDWSIPNKKITNCIDGGLYTQWYNNTIDIEKKGIAFQIAGLPIKPYPPRSLAWWNNR